MVGIRKITDADFKGWVAMHELEGRPEAWVWMNPGSTRVALVFVESGEVLWESSKNGMVVLYQHPEIQKFAKLLMSHPKIKFI